jgi:hypothetical protein
LGSFLLEPADLFVVALVILVPALFKFFVLRFLNNGINNAIINTILEITAMAEIAICG